MQWQPPILANTKPTDGYYSTEPADGDGYSTQCLPAADLQVSLSFSRKQCRIVFRVVFVFVSNFVLISAFVCVSSFIFVSVFSCSMHSWQLSQYTLTWLGLKGGLPPPVVGSCRDGGTIGSTHEQLSPLYPLSLQSIDLHEFRVTHDDIIWVQYFHIARGKNIYRIIWLAFDNCWSENQQSIFSVSGLWLSSPNYPTVFQCNVDQVWRFEGLLPKIIETSWRPECGQRLPVLLRELFEGKLVERRLNRPKNDFVLRISEDFLGLWGYHRWAS